MPKQKTNPDAGGVTRLAAMLSKSEVRGRGRKSSLTRWLLAHHDAFAAMLSEQQPSWEEVANALAAMGLRDGAHNPPNGERVRKAWWYARREVAARRAAQLSKPVVVQTAKVTQAAPLSAPSDIAPGVRGLAAEPLPQAPRPVPKFDIRPARPRDATRADPAPVLPVQGAASAAAPPQAAAPGQDGLSEQMRRISEAMDAGKTPMPNVTR